MWGARCTHPQPGDHSRAERLAWGAGRHGAVAADEGERTRPDRSVHIPSPAITQLTPRGRRVDLDRGSRSGSRGGMNAVQNRRDTTVEHGLQHTADFTFRWPDDSHFVGYLVNSEVESQAIISLWYPMDAIKFGSLYATLIELRARRSPPE